MQGWGERRRPKKVPGTAPLGCFSLSPVHLCSLFKLPAPPPPPFPYTQQDYGDWWCRFFFFFTFPLRQSLENTSCLCACTFEANSLIFCAGEVQSAELPSDFVTLSPNTLDRKDCHATLRSSAFFNVYYLHVFMHAFAWEYAPVPNEAVFVLIKQGGVHKHGGEW